MTVEPTLDGCRLTQQETLEVTPELLDVLEPVSVGGRSFRDLVGFFSLFPGLGPLGLELRRRQRERVAHRLKAELEAWLQAIKAQLEAGEGAREGRTA